MAGNRPGRPRAGSGPRRRRAPGKSIASADPPRAARWLSFTAPSASAGVPTPSWTQTASMSLASASPCAAARRNHWRAWCRCSWTSRLSRYADPTKEQASVEPAVAAARDRRNATRAFLRTPQPSAHSLPRMKLADGLPPCASRRRADCTRSRRDIRILRLWIRWGCGARWTTFRRVFLAPPFIKLLRFGAGFTCSPATSAPRHQSEGLPDLPDRPSCMRTAFDRHAQARIDCDGAGGDKRDGRPPRLAERDHPDRDFGDSACTQPNPGSGQV